MTNNEQRKKDRATFSIGNDYLKLIKLLAEIERTDMTKLLRIMIDERAAKNNIDPIVKR